MAQKHQSGILYLIPLPIEGPLAASLPPEVNLKIHSLEHFIAEKARTARRFIKTTNPPFAIQDIEVLEMERGLSVHSIQKQLQPLRAGKNMGLMSEAGLPCIADPGHQYVAYCHENAIPVVPLVGPSSIMLALMASGMNGQSFAFNGYLPAKKNELGSELKKLEKLAQRSKQTQIFIEAPYRNTQVVETAMKVLNDDTKFCIAMNLTTPDEFIFSQKIKSWKNSNLPNLHKQPAIFLMN